MEFYPIDLCSLEGEMIENMIIDLSFVIKPVHQMPKKNQSIR